MTLSTAPVLVIDDDPEIARVVRMALEFEGYRVLSAGNGSEAVGVLEQLVQPPALILLDMRMPVMDGWQFARVFHERWGWAVPLVVMTAAVDAAHWAGEIGASAFLAKPFNLDDLVSIVAHQLPGAPSGTLEGAGSS